MKNIFFYYILFLSSLLVHSQEKYSINVNIKNIQQIKGRIFCRIFDDETVFPLSEKALKSKVYSVKGESMTIDMGDYLSGDYAVVVFHDLNDNNKLDKMFFPPIPKEPYGFSTNPNILGRPSFEECKFYLDKNLNLDIILKD